MVYEDYKEIAKITHYYPFGAESIKAITLGCADFLSMYGPFQGGLGRLEQFVREIVNMENYYEWLKNRQ